MIIDDDDERESRTTTLITAENCHITISTPNTRVFTDDIDALLFYCFDYAAMTPRTLLMLPPLIISLISPAVHAACRRRQMRVIFSPLLPMPR